MKTTTMKRARFDVQGAQAQDARDEHAALTQGRLGRFRAPHYSVSASGLREEAFLACRGVLLLDDLAEFRRASLVDLRLALEAMGQSAPLIRYTVNAQTRRELAQHDRTALAHYDARLAAAYHLLAYGVQP